MATEQPTIPPSREQFKAKRRLTRKQQKFLARYIASGNGVQSALRSYDTNDVPTANSIARANLQIPSIREAVESAWARANITPDRWAGVLSRKLDAKSLVSLGKDDVREVEDHATQLKAVELSARMLGALEPPRKVAHAHAHLHRLQGMSAEDLEEIASGKARQANKLE